MVCWNHCGGLPRFCPSFIVLKAAVMVCCRFVVVMPLVVPQVALRMYDIVVQLLPKVAVMIYYVFVVQLVGTQLLCVVCSAVGGNQASDGNV